MNIKTAKGLLRENIKIMSLEELQHHRVRLIDAWRHSKADYGMEKAVQEGFYKIVLDHYASGFVPADLWLTHNLETVLDEVLKQEKLLQEAKK